MEQISNWEVLKTFQVTYGGKTIIVDLVRLQVLYAPRWSFFVQFEHESMLLNKHLLNDTLLWIGGGTITHSETQVLGPEIERQLGYPLPLAESNNPFEYTGDITITIIPLILGNLHAEKAKAPYSQKWYYRIFFSNITVVVAKSELAEFGGKWHRVYPDQFDENHFNLITGLLDKYEQLQADNR